jgi:hypothetical protein
MVCPRHTNDWHDRDGGFLDRCHATPPGFRFPAARFLRLPAADTIGPISVSAPETKGTLSDTAAGDKTQA